MNAAVVFTAVFVQYVWGDLLGAKKEDDKEERIWNSRRKKCRVNVADFVNTKKSIFLHQIQT